MPPHVIPLRITANSQVLRGAYLRDLDREIQLALRDPERGPIWCEIILEETQKYLEKRLHDLSSSAHADNLDKAAKSTRNALGAARSRVNACATDPFVALYVGRKRAVEKELTSYGEAANSAYRRRLEAMLFAPEKALCEALLPQVARMRAQISGASASDDKSVLAQARQLRAILAAKLKKVDDATPVINGESLFDPHVTIDEKYNAFWSSRAPEARAQERASFLSQWKKLPRVDGDSAQLTELGTYFTDGTVTMATGENLTRILRETAEELARGQRRLFGSLLQESILNHPQISNPTTLRDVHDKSAVMIGLNREAGLVSLTGNNAVDLVFFEGAKNAANQPGSKANELYKDMDDLKTSGVTMRFEESPSPQELLCVRVLGGFSLAMINGFQPKELEGSNFRDSFEIENAETFNVYSRVGIKWQPFDGDRDRLAQWRQGLILTGLCFSRSGDPADVLVQRTNQGYMYRPPRPLGPGRDKLMLPFDLREAANTLREQPEFTRCLEDDIKRVRVSKSVEELVQYLEWVYDNSEQLGIVRTESRFSLRYEEDESKGDTKAQIDGENNSKAALQPLTSEQAFDLVKTYWRNDTALLARLEARYAQDHLPAAEPIITPFPGQMPAPSPPMPAPPMPAGGVVAPPATPPTPFVAESVVPPTMPPFPTANAAPVQAPPMPQTQVPQTPQTQTPQPVQVDDLDFT